MLCGNKAHDGRNTGTWIPPRFCSILSSKLGSSCEDICKGFDWCVGYSDRLKGAKQKFKFGNEDCAVYPNKGRDEFPCPEEFEGSGGEVATDSGQLIPIPNTSLYGAGGFNCFAKIGKISSFIYVYLTK